MGGLLVLALLAACGSSGDDSSGGGDGGGGGGTAVPGEARVESDCAPDDGAAYSFHIGLAAASCDASPEGALLRITVWTGLDHMAGGAWNLAPSVGVAGTWYSPSGSSSDLVNGASGILRVTTWDETAGATGTYDVVLEDGTHLSGSFDAVACLGDGPLCG